MRKTTLLLITTLFAVGILFGQNLTQTIKGRITDIDTNQPIPGVNIWLIDSETKIGTSSDADGNYVLNKVPVGRQSIKMSSVGYEPVIFNELEVRSGKQMIINVTLKESFQSLNEVVVQPLFRKDKAQNNMATISARSFSVEEASRYAGGWNDPSRLASSFAGVTMAEGVNDNAIVIRGNAPKGILWRLEGVEIPAPNHLNGVNNGGGIETVFSVNMLDNSDFYTGAFHAEFGNAISGAFDMQFRSGNSETSENAFQVGTQGIDISSEGPFKKGGKASYLFNYRYSTMGLAGLLLDNDFGLPTYQDISFKINLPTKRSGTFSLWGIGGLSSVKFNPDENPVDWKDSFDNNKYNTGSDISACGLSHKINVTKNSYLKSSLALTYDKFKMDSRQLQRDKSVVLLADHNEDNLRLVVSSFFNHKFGNKHSNRTGINITNNQYSIDVKGNGNPSLSSDLVQIANQSGQINQYQLYTSSKFRLAKTLDFILGLNSSYFDMNDEFIAEPRASIVWRFIPRHSISFAFGKHSRLEPLRFYKAVNNNNITLNPYLKVTKAKHYVLAYDYRIRENLKLKLEGYYQDLYDVPVIDNDSYSLLNYKWDDYFSDALVNNGTGINSGIDITLERYMKMGYYYMVTGSFFDSKYTGGDGIERNTSYNRNYVINLLAGKEWNLKSNNILGLNTKIAYMGGNRFTPPNQAASQRNELVILDDNKAFEWQEDDKLFVDLAFNYKMNRTKSAHVFTVQAKNLLMQEEMFGWVYDFTKDKVVAKSLAMVYPYITYRIEF